VLVVYVKLLFLVLTLFSVIENSSESCGTIPSPFLSNLNQLHTHLKRDKHCRVCTCTSLLWFPGVNKTATLYFHSLESDTSTSVTTGGTYHLRVLMLHVPITDSTPTSTRTIGSTDTTTITQTTNSLRNRIP
jgi:hypothetical protein